MVPNIRFKGFSGDWEEVFLSEETEFFSGQTYSPDDIRKSGTLVLRSSNVHDNKIVLEDNVFIDNEVASSDNVRENDIIVVVRNGSRSLIGKHAVIKEKMENTVIGAFMTGLRAEKAKYISALLDTMQFEKEIYKNLGATINQITTGNLKKMQFIVASDKAEQEKIGDFFTKLDNVIELCEEELENYKEYKKAMLQKMFPKKGEKIPEIRFVGYDGDWEEKKLEMILKEYTEKTKIEDEYLLLSSTNDGIEVRDGRVSGSSNIGYKIIRKGNIVLSPQNLWLGNINYNSDFDIGMVSPSYKTYNLENISSMFCKYYIRLPIMFDEYVKASVQGASVVRRNLDADLFNDIVVKLPSLPEQEKIGSFFKNLDSITLKQEEQLENYKNFKKSMLQKMFV